MLFGVLVYFLKKIKWKVYLYSVNYKTDDIDVGKNALCWILGNYSVIVHCIVIVITDISVALMIF